MFSNFKTYLFILLIVFFGTIGFTLWLKDQISCEGKKVERYTKEGEVVDIKLESGKYNNLIYVVRLDNGNHTWTSDKVYDVRVGDGVRVSYTHDCHDQYYLNSMERLSN